MITEEIKKSECIRFSVKNDDEKEVGRAFIYLIKNDLNEKPYALLEDVFVDECERGKGKGKELLNEIIKRSKEVGCYKLIATSRFARENVHELYKKLGFKEHGKEFRMDF